MTVRQRRTPFAPSHIRFYPPCVEPRSLMRNWEQQGSVSNPQRQHIPWACLIHKTSWQIVEQITFQIPPSHRVFAVFCRRVLSSGFKSLMACRLVIAENDVVQRTASRSVCDGGFVFVAAGCTGQTGKRTRSTTASGASRRPGWTDPTVASS